VPSRRAPLLIIAQVDDASGEVLQDVAERLHAIGARNVQVLASLGKKGRPGHVLMIDVPAQREEDVAKLLAAELGVWGYRVLESRHQHFDIRVQGRPVSVQLGEERASSWRSAASGSSGTGGCWR